MFILTSEPRAWQWVRIERCKPYHMWWWSLSTLKVETAGPGVHGHSQLQVWGQPGILSQKKKSQTRINWCGLDPDSVTYPVASGSPILICMLQSINFFFKKKLIYLLILLKCLCVFLLGFISTNYTQEPIEARNYRQLEVNMWVLGTEYRFSSRELEIAI